MHLTNNGDGTYRYVFRANLTTAMMGATPITYERNLTHRVVIMMGGHAGPTDDDTFDFVPDGTALARRARSSRPRRARAVTTRTSSTGTAATGCRSRLARYVIRSARPTLRAARASTCAR